MARHAKTNVKFSEINKDELVKELKIIAEEMDSNICELVIGKLYLPLFLIEAVKWNNETPTNLEAVSFNLDGKPEIVESFDYSQNLVENNTLETSCVNLSALVDYYG